METLISAVQKMVVRDVVDYGKIKCKEINPGV
jgi:hypothetical protein